MDTPPTVLASASSSNPPLTNSSPGTAKFPVLPVVVAVIASVVAVALAVAGGAYYLSRSGRLPGSAKVSRQPAPVASVASHVVLLEPLLVNLADADGTSYLRVALALRVADETDKAGEAAKEEKGKDSKSMNETLAPVRDTVLTVLGRQTSDELLAADGKDRLRSAVKAALAKRNPELKISDVFFTDFLVQR